VGTGGLRVRPSPALDAGTLSDDTANPRWIVDLDVTWSPMPRLILAGEAVYGGESGVSFRRRGVPFAAPAATDKDVNWWGLYALAHYDIYDWLWLTFRYGFLRDEDAARTGVEQSLQSFTVAPILHLSRLARRFVRSASPIPGPLTRSTGLT